MDIVNDIVKQDNDEEKDTFVDTPDVWKSYFDRLLNSINKQAKEQLITESLAVQNTLLTPTPTLLKYSCLGFAFDSSSRENEAKNRYTIQLTPNKDMEGFMFLLELEVVASVESLTITNMGSAFVSAFGLNLEQSQEYLKHQSQLTTRFQQQTNETYAISRHINDGTDEHQQKLCLLMHGYNHSQRIGPPSKKLKCEIKERQKETKVKTIEETKETKVNTIEQTKETKILETIKNPDPIIVPFDSFQPWHCLLPETRMHHPEHPRKKDPFYTETFQSIKITSCSNTIPNPVCSMVAIIVRPDYDAIQNINCECWVGLRYVELLGHLKA